VMAKYGFADVLEESGAARLIPGWKGPLPTARGETRAENLRLAHAKLAAGAGTPAEVTAAEADLAAARQNLFDLTVLKSALCYKPAYIGMIGSLRKIKMVFASLAAEGISEERLKEVHAPIGLDLGGETPEEIAISIAAELIKERASLKRSLKVVAQAD